MSKLVRSQNSGRGVSDSLGGVLRPFGFCEYCLKKALSCAYYTQEAAALLIRFQVQLMICKLFDEHPGNKRQKHQTDDKISRPDTKSGFGHKRPGEVLSQLLFVVNKRFENVLILFKCRFIIPVCIAQFPCQDIGANHREC